MNVCVLGCGPAGVLAAHAVLRRGGDVKILAPGQPSKISGAQYLHDEIPGIDVSPMMVEYTKTGTQEGYARKLYGSADAPCSWQEFAVGPHMAWPLEDAYRLAWAAVASYITPVTITAPHIEQLLVTYDLVVSTIPKPSLCVKNEHEFAGKPVWITNQPPADDGGVCRTLDDNTIMYNGLGGDPWYRFSKIQGVMSTEYVQDTPGAVRVIKPLHNNCNCHEGLMHVGRYGKWKKSVLAHNAFYEVDFALQSMQ